MLENAEQLFDRFYPEFPKPWRARMLHYAELLLDWNSRINLISRKDSGHVLLHHLFHAMAVSAMVRDWRGATVLDVGTGGGLPGLPMAILYPDTHFVLVDSVQKKVAAVEEMAKELRLDNVEVIRARVESLPRAFDFVTGRAVTALDKFIPLVSPLIHERDGFNPASGIIYWKGGDWLAELERLGKIRPRRTLALESYLIDPWYEDKYILYFAARDLYQWAGVGLGRERR